MGEDETGRIKIEKYEMKQDEKEGAGRKGKEQVVNSSKHCTGEEEKGSATLPWTKLSNFT